MINTNINKILDSKKSLINTLNLQPNFSRSEEEGGCGVVGFCCSEKVRGEHIYEPSRLMHNRGNGKGGGIAAVGFNSDQLGVKNDVLNEYYILNIAFLDEKVKTDLEKDFIYSCFEVANFSKFETESNWKNIEGLEAKPPDVFRYFVRAKKKFLDDFIKKNNFENLDIIEAEDEFIYQNCFKLNQKYYASLGKQQAFVLSYGKNIMILKVVGFAEAIVKYYKIEDLSANIWIAHQRFPTKGRVWHPGGAHPFAGVNMALVHNGDFANYHSVTEHLIQRNIYPQFLTDTEVSALLFDLLSRTYHYPIEYIIEALAPTTERDFDCLPKAKQDIYRKLQVCHIHGSPDGPWFFIVCRNVYKKNKFQLLGITDTAMLRPQVFSFSDGDVQVGMIASEKQAIDAALESLSNDDKRICPIADRYWNARGGSHTDGGAFIFNLTPDSHGKLKISCTDKFGKSVYMAKQTQCFDFSKFDKKEKKKNINQIIDSTIENKLKEHIKQKNPNKLYTYICENLTSKASKPWTFNQFHLACNYIKDYARTHTLESSFAIETLNLLNDRIYSCGNKKRSHILQIVKTVLYDIFYQFPYLNDNIDNKSTYCLIDYATKATIRPPVGNEKTLLIDAKNFEPEGDNCDASLLVNAYMKGWKNFICFNCAGQRYIGCGLGPETPDVVIDVYGSSGDYLASGIDGLTIIVHQNAQDQLAQIIKKGKLVVYGDVGQTFMYGAKGGDVYVLGNAAGRPLINSVGRPRVVINGTCLDFLAESFMAGDPHDGGGFVILNGIFFNEDGKIENLTEPYPGSNIFSLASGGAIFIRDPDKKLVKQQLNGGMFQELTDDDVKLILPYLEENQRLFGISIDDLLTVSKNKKLLPKQVYRKIVPKTNK